MGKGHPLQGRGGHAEKEGGERARCVTLGVMAGVPGAVPDDHAEGGGEVDAQAPGLG